MASNLKINQTTYEQLKRKHQGFYMKFNQEIIKWHLNKIFNYEYLLETAKDHSNFTEFYYFHTKNKQDLIEAHLEQMYSEALRKGMALDKDWVFECLVVRLGNAYNGMFTEHKILETFSNLTHYITCKKTAKEIDMLYKVDGVVELIGIDKLAIQIKPISFMSYDKGSELQFHSKFTSEFGPEVYYILYKNKNVIVFNGVELKLDNKDKIIEQIENILVYN